MRRLLADSAAIFWREALRYKRDRAYWVGQIVFPLAVVAYFGFGMNRVVELPTGAPYASHLATGILILMVGSGAVGAGFSLIADRQSGFLRVLLIAPIARGSIVLGKLAARFVASLLAVSLLVAILAAFTPLAFVHYPWSHSLAMVLLWSVIAAIAAAVGLKSARSAIVVGAVVASHWLLDFVTHRPDLPLWPDGSKVGLGMWNTMLMNGCESTNILMSTAGMPPLMSMLKSAL